jgi:hypothetical protein
MTRTDAGDSTWELRKSEPVVVEWLRLLDDRRSPIAASVRLCPKRGGPPPSLANGCRPAGTVTAPWLSPITRRELPSCTDVRYSISESSPQASACR